MAGGLAAERELAARLVALSRARQWTITTAESCTGGLVAGAITAIPGASDVLEYGFVSYSNAAKTALLGVPAGVISAARLRANADLAVSVTGIAGPGGGTATKPVGTVWFGLAGREGDLLTRHRLFTGDRDQIRAASVSFALELLLKGISE
jgi:nicotinamide-nucleotide amidase